MENIINLKEKDLTKITIKYGGLISSIANRILKNKEDAKDASQAAWIEIIKSLPSFKGNSKLSTWIYKVAYRVIKNYDKKEKVYSSRTIDEFLDQGEILTVPGDSPVEKQLWIKDSCDKCVTSFLHCLTFENRIALVFKDIAGLSYQELSEIFEKDEIILRKQISRSRKKVRSFMEKDCLLFNPDGNCRCRLKTLIKEINLDEEYNRIKNSIKKINFYQVAEKMFPKINYWEKFYNKMSQKSIKLH